MNFESIADTIIKKTLSKGATDCDVVLARGSGKSISCRLQKIEDIEESNDKTFGIRALIGNRQAFVSSSDIEEDKLNESISKVVEMAKLAPDDNTACLGDKNFFENNFEDLNLHQEEETKTELLIDAVKECEEVALSTKGISNSEGAGASYSTGEFFLATSNGFRGGYKSSTNSISCSVLAGEGLSMERDYDYDLTRHLKDLEKPSVIGKSAAEKAIQRLNPKKIKSCKTSVVFDKRVSNDLLSYFASSISGPAIARETSFLKDSLHKKIFSKEVSIIDSPKILKGLGSRPFDGEGIKTNKKELVSNGTLNTWILNTSTAKKLNLKTTGHASRSVGSPPGVGTSNLYMVNGINSFEDMIKSIKSGFYATELIGMGVNLITGDYSMGASGLWIENGEIAFPVNEVTIASNLKEMFLNLSAANDLEFKYRANTPTLRVDGMTLAGK